MSIRFYDHRNENGYLSNFYVSPMWIDDVEWSTVEHCYQSMKYYGLSFGKEIAEQPTARKAKDLARSKTPNGWTVQRKVYVMRKVIFAKFEQNSQLLEKLINTGNDRIIEASPTDSFWGEGASKDGVNMMGLLLMEARSTLVPAKQRLRREG